VNGNAVRAVSVIPSAAKPTPVSSQSDDIVAPSHDFLKWLSDSLKGVNSTVNGTLVNSAMVRILTGIVS
jgi:PERQ amino acid-rich with GYF domain-containing protein